MSRIVNSDMVGTSQLVKRIDDCIAGRGSQVDINSRTVDGMVAEIRSQGKKIHAVLIAVCCISVPQGMGTEAAVQPEGFFFSRMIFWIHCLSIGFCIFVCWVKSQVLGRMCRGLGYGDAVTSPTYTIVNKYLGGRLPLFHFDMYRLRSAEDLWDIGWEDHLDRGDCPKTQII